MYSLIEKILFTEFKEQGKQWKAVNPCISHLLNRPLSLRHEPTLIYRGRSKPLYKNDWNLHSIQKVFFLIMDLV